MKTFISLLVTLIASAGAAQAQDAKGDAKAGEKKAAMCLGCHNIPGYQATFPVIFKVPMISGQNEKFIAASLQAYKKGERKHPTMRSIADSLNDQDIADLAAFYAQLGGQPARAPEQPAVQPPPQVAALLQKGACASCHGANFTKPIDGSYPKVAGQHADYLYESLKAYQTQNNQYIGRANAIMAAQVKQFSTAELKEISDYLASLPGELRTVSAHRFK